MKVKALIMENLQHSSDSCQPCSSSEQDGLFEMKNNEELIRINSSTPTLNLSSQVTVSPKFRDVILNARLDSTLQIVCLCIDFRFS